MPLVQIAGINFHESEWLPEMPDGSDASNKDETLRGAVWNYRGSKPLNLDTLVDEGGDDFIEHVLTRRAIRITSNQPFELRKSRWEEVNDDGALDTRIPHLESDGITSIRAITRNDSREATTDLHSPHAILATMQEFAPLLEPFSALHAEVRSDTFGIFGNALFTRKPDDIANATKNTNKLNNIDNQELLPLFLLDRLVAKQAEDSLGGSPIESTKTGKSAMEALGRFREAIVASVPALRAEYPAAVFIWNSQIEGEPLTHRCNIGNEDENFAVRSMCID